jgi:hypothetical protein
VKLSLIILFLVALTGFECKKSAPNGPVFTGRLIVNGPCEHYAIQLISGTIDTANIEASWYDSANDSTYTNAFSVSNFCTFGNNGLLLGDVFTFQIDPNPKVQTCPICMIAVPLPSKQNAVIDVQKVK